SRYYLILAKDLGYGATSSLTTSLDEVSRLLNAYASAILRTPDFHIPQGYQGRSPCLVRTTTLFGGDHHFCRLFLRSARSNCSKLLQDSGRIGCCRFCNFSRIK